MGGGGGDSGRFLKKSRRVLRNFYQINVRMIPMFGCSIVIIGPI